jgi:hypothetical protein
MLRPKFTDMHRYPHGYTHATDVSKTFARLRRETIKVEKASAAIEAEQIEKVRKIRSAR